MMHWRIETSFRVVGNTRKAVARFSTWKKRAFLVVGLLLMRRAE